MPFLPFGAPSSNATLTLHGSFFVPTTVFDPTNNPPPPPPAAGWEVGPPEEADRPSAKDEATGVVLAKNGFPNSVEFKFVESPFGVGVEGRESPRPLERSREVIGWAADGGPSVEVGVGVVEPPALSLAEGVKVPFVIGPWFEDMLANGQLLLLRGLRGGAMGRRKLVVLGGGCEGDARASRATDLRFDLAINLASFRDLLPGGQDQAEKMLEGLGPVAGSRKEGDVSSHSVVGGEGRSRTPLALLPKLSPLQHSRRKTYTGRPDASERRKTEMVFWRMGEG